jgi:hypothetical protein
LKRKIKLLNNLIDRNFRPGSIFTVPLKNRKSTFLLHNFSTFSFHNSLKDRKHRPVKKKGEYKMKKRTKILGIALALAAILTLAISTAVFADAPGNDSTQEYCGGIGWHGFNGNGGFCSDAVSDLLGLTPEELHELRLEGNSLADIATDNNVSVDALIDAIMADKVEAVEAKVANGTLTREQADLMIQQMTQRTEQTVNRTTVGPTEWSGGSRRMYGDGACGSSMNRRGGQDNTGTGSGFGSGMGHMRGNSY